MSKKLLALIIFILIGLPSIGQAATLYFRPETGSLGPGNTFALDILIDVSSCANAIEADVSFSKDDIELKDFIIGESILALWVKKPNESDMAEANKNGILNFIGGVPGGYCGKIPGDLGNSNTVARLIFQVKNSVVASEQKTKIDISFLPTTMVLLNDGLGTKDNLSTRSASFALSREKVNVDDTWSTQISNDTIPPEPFIVELRQNKGMFDNQYYIDFNTTDKQSGMDHFEVLEIRSDQIEGVIKEPSLLEKIIGKKGYAPVWQVATIPYLLTDQTLTSTIRVKAIDKAGNERFVEYIPPESKRGVVKKASNIEWVIIGSLLLIILVSLSALLIFLKKIISKKRYDKEGD